VIRAGKSEGLLKVFIQIERELPGNIPLLCQCADMTLTEIATWARYPERIVGFDGLFFHQGRAATLIPSPTLNRQTRAATEKWAISLGYLPVWIQDSPALILPRIVCMLANEAAFAVMDGVAEPEKIDLAMRLGVNYPKGPLSWAKEIGYAQVVVVLDHLFAEYHEERYRAAPLLRRWARLERIYA
jgi:3-hydroxybutyryl-CoA dehydrogenase